MPQIEHGDLVALLMTRSTSRRRRSTISAPRSTAISSAKRAPSTSRSSSGSPSGGCGSRRSVTVSSSARASCSSCCGSTSLTVSWCSTTMPQRLNNSSPSSSMAAEHYEVHHPDRLVAAAQKAFDAISTACYELAKGGTSWLGAPGSQAAISVRIRNMYGHYGAGWPNTRARSAQRTPKRFHRGGCRVALSTTPVRRHRSRSAHGSGRRGNGAGRPPGGATAQPTLPRPAQSPPAHPGCPARHRSPQVSPGTGRTWCSPDTLPAGTRRTP